MREVCPTALTDTDGKEQLLHGRKRDLDSSGLEKKRSFCATVGKGACLESCWEMEMCCRRAKLNSKYLEGKGTLAK